MENVAGIKLGRYEVVKHLASGGMAQVLLARSSGIEGFERHVVIKRIHRERATDESAVKMFLDEARLAAALHHTNVVQVHDIGQENGEYFFAMEYIHGEDLRRLLTQVAGKHQQIPLPHVISIVAAAASALHYAHEFRGLNIVHRDVSPANVLLGYDGTVKVVDFGIAKAAFRSTETQSGTLKGKISYMAPEQCMGQSVDRRSDVFALGIVFYELLTARRLFKNSSDFLTMSQIVAGHIPDPTEHRPDLPPELAEIVLRALTLSPAERYQTADELRLALDGYGQRSSTSELADYMLSLFGRRIEPWLTDEDPEIKVDVDFDGRGSGVAEAPERTMTPPPGSLLARARHKNAAPRGIPLMVQPPPSAAVIAEPAPATNTSSLTPMAWSTPAAVAVAPRKRLAVVLGSLGVLAASGLAFLFLSAKAAPTVTPAAAAPAAAPLITAPPPSEPATPPVAPVVADAPEPTPAPVVVQKPMKKAGKKTITKKIGTKTQPDKWDPTKLMPD